MKNFVGIFIFLLLINLLVPLGYSKIYTNFPIKNIDELKIENQTNEETISEDEVELFDESTGTKIQVPIKDYIINAAACEMPATYEENAIKAQMIAIHSYYLYCQNNPTYLEKGCISVNSKNMQGYTDKTKLTEFWGTSFYDFYAKFERCYEDVKNLIVTFDNLPALTSYYAVSCGKTRDSKDVWEQSIPYLVSVDSSHDAISDKYLNIKKFSVYDMYSLLKGSFPSLKISEDNPEEWFGEISYFNSGYGQYIKIAGDLVPADQFRKALNLQSTCLIVFFEDNEFSVATKGYGHGVGMSQFGANYLSQQGNDYKEILSYYFPNTSITEI